LFGRESLLQSMFARWVLLAQRGRETLPLRLMDDSPMHENESNAADIARRVAHHMLAHDKASQFLGMTLDFVDDRKVVVSMRLTESHLNGHGTGHGGLVFALADTAFAIACNTQNHAAVAAGGSIDFVSPGVGGELLTASAIQRSQGRRLGVYDIDVTGEDGRLVAIFRGRSARLTRPVIPLEGE
jgi:acyl-CoA thioesterase